MTENTDNLKLIVIKKNIKITLKTLTKYVITVVTKTYCNVRIKTW